MARAKLCRFTMNKLLTGAVISTVVVFLISCSQTQRTRAELSQIAPCDTGAVKLTANFPTARMDSCERTSDNSFSVVLKPENTPINSSPWYAFKVQAETPVKVNIAMRVEGHPHRYLPKQSTDLKTWDLIDFRDREDVRSFTVIADSKPKYIAGQEILSNQFYIDWAKELKAKYELSHNILGHTLESRPIYKIESRSGSSEQWLVILGRMHPPEITGALALFPFVDSLLSGSELAVKFRDRFNILIVPNLNPDGVAAGNWRHNLNGVDLNRDWQAFKQPEVKAVHEYLQELVNAGEKMSMAVDFHSTRRDIFYTMPNDYGVAQPFLVNNWLGALDKQYPNFSVIQKPGNNPNKGVFKQYFADHYKVHAITYEMGDNTNRDFINQLAKDAANKLMTTMLENNEEQKYE